jgi:hypothetical protein
MNMFYLVLIIVALVVYIIYLLSWNIEFQRRLTELKKFNKQLERDNKTLINVEPGYTFEVDVPPHLASFVNSYSETGIESTQRGNLQVVHGSYPRDCKLTMMHCHFPECGCGR